jgi:hypothetical protein
VLVLASNCLGKEEFEPIFFFIDPTLGSKPFFELVNVGCLEEPFVSQMNTSIVVPKPHSAHCLH